MYNIEKSTKCDRRKNILTCDTISISMKFHGMIFKQYIQFKEKKKVHFYTARIRALL